MTDDQLSEDELRDALSLDNHDKVVTYRADDESLLETLNRLLALVPTRGRVSNAGIDPDSLDGETRIAIVQWRDEDGLMQTWVYESPMAVADSFPIGVYGYEPPLEEGDDD